MKYSPQDIGAIGEKLAVKFLISRKFKILVKNFSCSLGEIDIVARQNNYTVFFEVKTRTSERFGSALESVTHKKQKHIIRNCQYYLKKHNLLDAPCRIDVIGIKLDRNGQLETLNHAKDAVQIIHT